MAAPDVIATKALAWVLVLLFALSGCGGGGSQLPPIPITVSVTASSSSVMAGGTAQVTATVANRLAVDSGLQEGDVVHSLNRTAIKTANDLRAAFDKLQPGDPAAMLIERAGKLTYVTFEME